MKIKYFMLVMPFILSSALDAGQYKGRATIELPKKLCSKKDNKPKDRKIHIAAIEKAKKIGGTHTRGIAADIYVNGGRQRMQIVRHACAMGFVGIGVAKAFVHVDMRDDFKPVLWCY